MLKISICISKISISLVFQLLFSEIRQETLLNEIGNFGNILTLIKGKLFIKNVYKHVYKHYSEHNQMNVRPVILDTKITKLRKAR